MPSVKPRPTGPSSEESTPSEVVWGADLRRLVHSYRRLVSPATALVVLAVASGVALAGLHVSRVGLGPFRLAGGLLLASALLGYALFVAWRRRSERDAARAIRQTLAGSDPALGEKTLRALALLHQARKRPDVGSEDLARRHFERLIGRASPERVQAVAQRRARRLRLVAWPLLAVAAALALSPGWNKEGASFDTARLLEGLNVLLAREGVAPFRGLWLERFADGASRGPEVLVKPPSYLRRSASQVALGTRTRESAGSEVTVRGQPRHRGRRLVLTDGQKEQEFVDDGSGAVVAHWRLERSTSLWVAARFGEVRVDEPEPLQVEVVPDAAPEVVLEGAPSTVHLEEVESVELRYLATDDHGLRQVDLVLRSAGQEERRVLLRLDGQTKLEQGAYALSSQDAFLRRVFLPVLVTVEARDNDPLARDKWGRSEAVTVMPPAVGALQARRIERLVSLRDALTDELAWLMGPQGATLARARLKATAKRLLEEARSGEAIGRGVMRFVEGQLGGLARVPAGKEQERVEQALLALDMLARRQAFGEARAVAKQLSDVAEEAARAAQKAAAAEPAPFAEGRLEGALLVLEEGAKNLSRLLDLGRDLGAVAKSDLGRVRRAQQQSDFFHAELAARHLSLRLRRANPSYGSASGGVESGAGDQSAADPDTSNADQKFDQWAMDLERLALEHAREITAVEAALEEAERELDAEPFRAEAQARAEAIRQAVRPLPEVGAPPGTAEGAAAVAREYARAMAQDLDRLSLRSALESGQGAMGTLKETERKRQVQGDSFGLPSREALGQVQSELEEHVAWVERTLEQLRGRGSGNVQQRLESSAKREAELGRWAEQLRRRAETGEVSAPEDTQSGLKQAEQLMRQAEAELRAGQGQRGRELQMQAQRHLEQASTGTTEQGSGAADGGRAGSSNRGEVPEAERRRQAEEFRKRVLEGLSRGGGGKLAPAVKRYAEGLIQ